MIRVINSQFRPQTSVWEFHSSFRIRTADSVQEAFVTTDTEIVLCASLLKYNYYINYRQETGLPRGACDKPFPLHVLGTPAKCNYVWRRIGRFVKL